MYQTPYPVMQVLKNIITDPKVLSFALIIAGCNGIQFSYYAEGPFYLIGLLGLTPFLYGLSFIFIALAGVLGGWISRSLQGKVMPYDILIGGITTTLIGSLIFVGSVYLKDVLDLSTSWLSVATLSCMTIIVTGMSIALPNCHSLSLRDYQYAVGSASSIFGFLYYCLISLFTFFMGWMHNNTLYPMPLYFLSISLFLLIMSYSIKRSEQP
jgi:membrane-bound ClpP family serine protease